MWVVGEGKMDLSLVLVFCAATLSLVHTNHVLDSVQRNTLHADSIIQTSFGFRDEHGEQTKRSETSSIVSSPQKKRRSVSSDPSNLKLAAFNVRTFGTKKMATPGVPDILVKVGMLSLHFVDVSKILESASYYNITLATLVALVFFVFFVLIFVVCVWTLSLNLGKLCREYLYSDVT